MCFDIYIIEKCGDETKSERYLYISWVLKKVWDFTLFPSKVIPPGQNHLGEKWRHDSCACLKIFALLGRLISQMLRLEYRRVLLSCRIFVFMKMAEGIEQRYSINFWQNFGDMLKLKPSRRFSKLLTISVWHNSFKRGRTSVES